jgi:hypothetical protein
LHMVDGCMLGFTIVPYGDPAVCFVRTVEEGVAQLQTFILTPLQDTIRAGVGDTGRPVLYPAGPAFNGSGAA